MSKVLVEESTLQNIANSIRLKNGQETLYKPADMSAAVNNLASTERNGILGSPFVTFDSSNPFFISTGNNTLDVVTAGIAKSKSIGHPAILILFFRGTSINFNIVSNNTPILEGYNLVYSSGYIQVYQGLLNRTLEITESFDGMSISIIEIMDGYDAVPYSNLCTNIENTTPIVRPAATTDLILRDGFDVYMAIPAGYGISILNTTYDYGDSNYQPSVWADLNSLYASIPIRHTSGSYATTGFAAFLNIDGSNTLRNKRYVRGSISTTLGTYRELDSSTSGLNISACSGNAVTSNDFHMFSTTRPDWSMAINVAYIRVIPSSNNSESE